LLHIRLLTDPRSRCFSEPVLGVILLLAGIATGSKIEAPHQGEAPMVDRINGIGKARATGPSPRLILDSIKACRRSAALEAAVTFDVFSAIAAGATTPAHGCICWPVPAPAAAC
jgi:hypothetical protein